MAGVRLLLSLVIIVFASTICIYWVEARKSAEAQVSYQDNGGRNERSTPRSFVLPATPAVAREQEIRYQEESSKTEMAMLAHCTAQLVVRGYDVGDDPEPVSFDAKLVEAIFIFQRDHGLGATGHLDAKTRKALGC